METTMTKKLKKLTPKVNPENAEQLWLALFAITHAVEQLELAVDVNKYRNTEMDVGAWEYARLALRSADMTSDVN
tara:strand:- start:5716 stop:5940 length:225 start_codon:yes stop_codon:yes gene_type:complete